MGSDNQAEIDVVQLGSITFLNYDIEEENKSKKKSNDKCSGKVTIKFDNENEVLCFQINEGDSSLLKDKEKIAILRDKASYYTLYLKYIKETKGYYYDESSQEIIIVQEIDPTTFLAYYSKVDIENGIEESDILEEHFAGASAHKIEDSFIEIKKEYCADYTKYKLAAIGVVVIVLLAIFASILFEETPPPPPPPPPAYSNLSDKQIISLKEHASRELLKNIKDVIKEISKDELLNQGKERVVLYTQEKWGVLAPERAVKSGERYYYKHENLKKGGLSVSFNKTYQIIYPKSGFIMSKKGLYVKEEREVFTYTPDQIESNDAVLTEKCIQDALHIAPKNTFVYQRDESKIIFKFEKMKASDFLAKAESMLDRCPSYLEEISISSGTFQGSLILYAKERL